MSGGTPIGGGYMRQRHNSQGYTSSGDDLEDDACSRPIYQPPSSSRSRRWVEIMENLLWISSVIFIVYYGDRRSNFIYLLWHDDRIKRIPLYVGLIGVGLNVLFFFYMSIIARGLRKSTEKWDASSTPALPFFYHDWDSILLLVLFCFVANLEFFDIASCVHSIHGIHGDSAIRIPGHIKETNLFVSDRLNVIGIHSGISLFQHS